MQSLTMKPSAKLSPKLRRHVLSGDQHRTVSGIAQVAPGADWDALRLRLEAVGADVNSWSRQAGIITLTIPVGRLQELDAVDEIVYVEASEPYRP